MARNKAQDFNWQEKYQDRLGAADAAIKLIKPGDHIFIGSGCSAPQHLIKALVEYSQHIYDAHIVHILTRGEAPYVQDKYRDKFKVNTYYISDNVREAVQKGIADYTPIFLSEVPLEFEEGRCAIDVALISVSPPDARAVQPRRVGGRGQVGRFQRQVRHRAGQPAHAAHAGRCLPARQRHRHARAVRGAGAGAADGRAG